MQIVDPGALVTIALALISGTIQLVLYARRWREIQERLMRLFLLASAGVTLYFVYPYTALALGAPATIGASRIRPAIDMLILSTALLSAFTYQYHRSVQIIEEARRDRARDAQEAARRLMIAEEERKRLAHSIEQMQTIWFHEARTPLTAFMTSIPLLGDPEYAEVHDEVLFRMESASRRIGLYLDYLSALETAVYPSLFELTGVVGQILNSPDIFVATRRKPEDISLHYEQVVPILIQADQEKIASVIVELLRNAIKFNAPGGEVFIELERANGDIVLAVRDTGIGIEENDYDQIFEIGFQVDNSSTRHYEGHGFGLAMVRRVVHAHYGTVEVESKPGEGSTFTVKLPR